MEHEGSRVYNHNCMQLAYMYMYTLNYTLCNTVSSAYQISRPWCECVPVLRVVNLGMHEYMCMSPTGEVTYWVWPTTDWDSGGWLSWTWHCSTMEVWCWHCHLLRRCAYIYIHPTWANTHTYVYVHYNVRCARCIHDTYNQWLHKLGHSCVCMQSYTDHL